MDEKYVYRIKNNGTLRAKELVIVHFTVTQEVRDKLLNAVKLIKRMKDEDGIEDFEISFPVPCSVYLQTADQVDHTQPLCLRGRKVRKFPIVEKYTYQCDSDKVILTVSKPGWGVLLEYEYFLFGRFKTSSGFLGALADEFYDTLLTQ